MTEEQETRQKILDAAFSEFADKGFRGATIKSIAKKAGIKSPSLLYWYFPTKESLFQATIESRSPFLDVILDPIPFMDKPPETFFRHLADNYYHLLTQADFQNMIRLFFSEMGKRPQLTNVIQQGVIEPALDFLRKYLSHQVELGRLRPHDVRVGARAFIGMLLPQFLGMVIFHDLGGDDLPYEIHVEKAIEIFLDGLRE
ncbi:MAG: TetR/AcrR family transcriptional regulator [Anaerolineales bacterium]|nr:TetR/AcrR family transcriptional regulator [Anaerolineales bacterium]